MGGTREAGPEGLPFHLADYLDLVNWTGRAVCDDKRGAIAEDLPPILERIGITRAAWLQLAKDFETTFCIWIGQAEHVERACERNRQRYTDDESFLGGHRESPGVAGDQGHGQESGPAHARPRPLSESQHRCYDLCGGRALMG